MATREKKKKKPQSKRSKAEEPFSRPIAIGI